MQNENICGQRKNITEEESEQHGSRMKVDHGLNLLIYFVSTL